MTRKFTRKTVKKDFHKFYLEDTKLCIIQDFFTRLLAEVPEDFKLAAECHLEIVYDENESKYLRVEVSYAYPETKDEAKIRRAAEKVEEQRKIDAELKQLQYLLDKHKAVGKR